MDFVPPQAAIAAALREAEFYIGATAPNPPVGAAAWDAHGHVLAAAAHMRAGTEHAEAKLIRLLREQGLLERAVGLFVTLEPCNHHGRTPPCTQAIRDARIAHVFYAVPDPNPDVIGGGHEALEAHGIWVHAVDVPEAREQLAPFVRKVTGGLPWITLKQAFSENGSMIPPAGQKTFTSPTSLDLAHALRKRSDAIVTSARTIIADRPLLDVRRVADHPDRQRAVYVIESRDQETRMQQSARLAAWEREAVTRKLKMVRVENLDALAAALKAAPVLRVLVEAGPTLSQALIDRGLWDDRVEIHAQHAKPDAVRWFRADRR